MVPDILSVALAILKGLLCEGLRYDSSRSYSAAVVCICRVHSVQADGCNCQLTTDVLDIWIGVLYRSMLLSF